jgi:hypothetical protein
MASIKLDVVNYMDETGTFDPQVLHELTEGLDVTFDEAELHVEVPSGAILMSLVLEFTGPRDDLVELVNRYVGSEYDNEPDMDPRPDLIAEIKD